MNAWDQNVQTTITHKIPQQYQISANKIREKVKVKAFAFT